MKPSAFWWLQYSTTGQEGLPIHPTGGHLSIQISIISHWIHQGSKPRGLTLETDITTHILAAPLLLKLKSIYCGGSSYCTAHRLDFLFAWYLTSQRLSWGSNGMADMSMLNVLRLLINMICPLCSIRWPGLSGEGGEVRKTKLFMVIEWIPNI